MQDISSEINELLPFKGRFAISQIQELSSRALRSLDNDEKKELESFTSLRRQKEYVSSRLALKSLARSIGAPKLKILKDTLGQPYGEAGNKKYFISIAHTDQTVFCGISAEQGIGVDLEPTSREVTERLRARILHSQETAPFIEMPAVQLWTLKEAYIKLRGQGLRLNMNEVWLRDKKAGYIVELDNDKRAKICSFQKYGNWLAIAYYQ